MDQAGSAPELKLLVSEILGDTLGAFPPPWISWPYRKLGDYFRLSQANRGSNRDFGPALRDAIVFTLCFWFVPWMARKLDVEALSYTDEMLRLAFYGGIWFWWAAWSSRMTSRRVKSIIVERVVDKYPEELKQSLKGEISNTRYLKYASIIATAIGLLLAIVATGSVSMWFQNHNIGLIWWAIEWFLIFYVAARGVIVGNFYVKFCRYLSIAPDILYKYDPARSAIVQDLSKIGQTMVLFWFGIAISILFVIPFIVEPIQAVKISAEYMLHFQFRNAVAALPQIKNQAYLDSIIPITIFGSAIIGTVAFLVSENWIANAVEKARSLTMFDLETKVRAGASARPNDLQPIDLEQFARLHQRLANGRYRSVGFSALSVATPLVGVAASALTHLIAG